MSDTAREALYAAIDRLAEGMTGKAAPVQEVAVRWEICRHCGHDMKDPCHHNDNPNAAANCHWNRERTRVFGTGLANNRPTPSAAPQQARETDAAVERKAAERAYISIAFDYAKEPVGSRDWCLFWDGYRAALARPAPDAAIADRLAEALSELADLMDDVRSGNYKPDSFTTQPARAILAAYDATKEQSNG